MCTVHIIPHCRLVLKMHVKTYHTHKTQCKCKNSINKTCMICAFNINKITLIAI